MHDDYYIVTLLSVWMTNSPPKWILAMYGILSAKKNFIADSKDIYIFSYFPHPLLPMPQPYHPQLGCISSTTCLAQISIFVLTQYLGLTSCHHLQVSMQPLPQSPLMWISSSLKCSNILVVRGQYRAHSVLRYAILSGTTNKRFLLR